MATKCSQSFYDALGGKHRSRELFVVVLAAAKEKVTEKTTYETYEIVCGMPANDQQLRVDDLAMLFRDERFTATVHSYLFEETVPFNPENFRGRQGRAAFDPAAASTLLGKSYPLWLKECARNLPAAPGESVTYSKKVGEEFLKVVSGVGLYYDIAGAPGVLVAGPESLAKRFWGNSGMVDTAARAVVDRLTPSLTAEEAELLCEYLGSISPEEQTGLLLKALERLGLWDTQAIIEVPPLEDHAPLDEDDASNPLAGFPDLDPPSAFMDGLRARALLLELELGVPGLAAVLGCSSDHEQVRLGVYDLAGGSARHRSVYTSAQAKVDRRAGDVARTLSERHGLVTYALEATLHANGAFASPIGAPICSGGVPLAHIALVGMTADGRVFSFEDSDRIGDGDDVTFFSEENLKNCFWHPDVDDSIRGTRGEALGYQQRLAESLKNLEDARGSIFERIVEEAYDELVTSGGEYDGEREARARLLARLAVLPAL